jgi:hypothetical protein
MGILQDLKDNIIGTKEQNRIAQENLDMQARKGSKLAKFLGGNDQGMYVPEEVGALGTVDQVGMTQSSPTQKSSEFNLYNTVKKAADEDGMKKGGKVKTKASSASKRADGCCVKGKTKGKML